jgi:hypothetical protein
MYSSEEVLVLVSHSRSSAYILLPISGLRHNRVYPFLFLTVSPIGAIISVMRFEYHTSPCGGSLFSRYRCIRDATGLLSTTDAAGWIYSPTGVLVALLDSSGEKSLDDREGMSRHFLGGDSSPPIPWNAKFALQFPVREKVVVAVLFRKVKFYCLLPESPSKEVQES